ncbi:conjugative transfer relaxase/helicase TraI [Klebsiella aerogenes]|uniref:conjugative transfer relaxase/helicase TraI n=1 Tax=Klebsiella aerogenes TaxID=548 RepID=UPI000DA25E26|nr:conjugative transfer relaxase/helicase TraI [Klebsiella aerogenes]HCB2859825.1 conjugative transfer relaxase/helicase TraI [Klebsiella aerogenes]HCB2864828.1 conjugative transfer relaxase/helicase TraI [Klebsiella aerogenes]HCB2880500.1 conjugative transfer relaxase/helicase TraI [Klebsiella aerogenes]HCB3345891.1 conjugative transfer relaxase/helicase TraI [Klebsiella aerogenes]HCM1811893.1 conjugative transfer relaxase/helicase TraI [Klebsiella aerogenes]
MLTVAPAVNSASYYMDRDNYYFLGEADSRWMGKGAEALGLDGPVRQEDFERALQGLFQGDVDITRTSGGKNAHRGGYDLTLSAPKSVSVMAVVLGDSRFIEAHNRALEAVAVEIEKLTSTRTMTDGVKEIVGTGNMVAALFNHDTSRELDPQLHGHLVVLNATEHNGEWKTLASDRRGKAGFIENVFALQVALGKVYRHSLRQDIEEMGFVTRETGKNGLWEIEGVPVEIFSRRSQQIREAVGDDASLKSRDVAALDTRQAKQKEPDRVELLTDWMQRLDEAGFSAKDFREAAEARVAEREQTGDVSRPGRGLPENAEVNRAVMDAISSLSEQRARFSYSDVLNHTLNSLDAREGVSVLARAAIDAAIRTQQLIPLDKEKGMFTSAIHMMDELSLQQVAGMHLDSSVVPVLSSPDTSLASGLAQQLAAERPVMAILTAHGGAASLREGVRDAITVAQAQGRQVTVLATDVAARRWLESELPDVPVMSLQTLATHGPETAGTLVVAGAERLSVRDALTVTDTAWRNGVQVLLADSGGRRGTGQALQTLEDAGVKRYDMAAQRTVNVSIHSQPDRRGRLAALAETYAGMQLQGEPVVAQAGGIRERQALTEQIRETLAEKGLLGSRRTRLSMLTPVWLDTKNRGQTSTYREGMVLEHFSDDSRFPVRYTIDRIGAENRTLRLRDEKGRLQGLKIAELDDSWRLYQQTTSEVAEGEKLTWLARQGKLRAGDSVTVRKVRKGGLEVEHNGESVIVHTGQPLKAGYAYVSTPGARVAEHGTVLAAVSAKETSATHLNQLARSGSDIRVFTPLSEEEARQRLSRSPHFRTMLAQVVPAGDTPQKAVDEAQAALMPTVEKAVRQAIVVTQGSEVVFNRLDVVVNAMPMHASVTGADVDREITAQVTRGELIAVPGAKGTIQQSYITATSYEAEKRLITLVAKGLDTQQPLLANADSRLFDGLTAGQQAASRRMLESRDQFVAVQGSAGVGKTTQLKAFLAAIDTLPAEARPQVRGLAPTHRAVGEMAAVGVKAQTLASFLMETERDMQSGSVADYRRTVFLVDESSMVGNRDFADAMSRIAVGGGRAVLSGDRDQLLSVENGAPFGLLQTRSLLETAIMKDIVRQTPALRPAVYAMLDRNVREAMTVVESVSPLQVPREPDRWKPTSSVVSIPQTRKDRAEHGDRVIQAIISDFTGRTPEARAQTLIVTQTNADKDAINAGIHNALQKQGELGREREVPVLVRVKTQADQLKSVAGMAKHHGKVALINDRYYTIRATKEGNAGGFVELVGRDGQAQALSAFESSLRDIAIFERREIAVSVGESVSFSRSDRERGREANSNWTVTAVERDGTMHLAQGETVRVVNPVADMDDRHLDYGYAGTAHKAQGASERFVIMLAGVTGGRQFLATLRDAYVALSRMKEHVQVYSDNLDKWRDTVVAAKDRQTAHDVLHGDSDRQAASAQRLREKARPLGDTPLGRALMRTAGDLGDALLIHGSRKYPSAHAGWPAYDSTGRQQAVMMSEIRMREDGVLEGLSPGLRRFGGDNTTSLLFRQSRNGITDVVSTLQEARQRAQAVKDNGIVVMKAGEVLPDRVLRTISGGVLAPDLAASAEDQKTDATADPGSLKTPQERAEEQALQEEARRLARTEKEMLPAEALRDATGKEKEAARELAQEEQALLREQSRELRASVEQLKQHDAQALLRQQEREIVREKTLGE